MIEAVLPNGTKLQFPDGTDGYVIKETVAKFSQSTPPEQVFVDRVVDFTPVMKEYAEALLKAVPSDFPTPVANIQVPVPTVDVQVDAPEVKVDAPNVDVTVEPLDVSAIVSAINAGFTQLGVVIQQSSELQHAANLQIMEALSRIGMPREVIRDEKGLIKGIK